MNWFNFWRDTVSKPVQQSGYSIRLNISKLEENVCSKINVTDTDTVSYKE